MNKRLWTTVLTAAGLAWGGVMAQGDELARWNSNNSDPIAASFAVSSKAEELTVSDLARGNGLVFTGSGYAKNTFAARNYDQTSYAAALSGGDYWETTLTPGANLLALEALSYSFGGPKSGPMAWQWAYRAGTSGAWTPLGTPHVSSRTGTAYEAETIDLTGIPLSAQPVAFRLVAWNGGSAATAWGNFGQAVDVLTITGTLESSGGAPVVRFTPASGSVDVGQTLEMAVAAMPPGSGISSWSLSPTPAGAASLAGGTFTFTPASADELKRFALTVTATNKEGSTVAETSVFVNEKSEPGTLTLTFDNEAKTNMMATATLEIPSGSGLKWELSKCGISTEGVEGGDQVYSKTAGRALRFPYDDSGVFTSKSKIVALSKAGDETQTNGVAKISFWYGIFKGDAGEESEHPVRPAIVTELSDDGRLWVEVGRVATEGTEEDMAEAEFEVGVETPVYLRIRTEGVTGSSRVNVDQLRVVPKTTLKNPLNLFLLKYNVTPGDALTTAGDDWDGDGKTNLQERRADPETNPYDRNSK